MLRYGVARSAFSLKHKSDFNRTYVDASTAFVPSSLLRPCEQYQAIKHEVVPIRLFSTFSSTLYEAFAHAHDEQEFVKEKHTGFSFPKELQFDGRKFSLFGTSARLLTIFKFNTYAVGMYMDKNQANTMAKKWKDKPLEVLMTDADFAREVSDTTKVEKVLRIVPARSVQGAHMYGGFGENLRTRLIQKCSEEETNQILEQFQQEIFPMKKNFPKGSTIDLVCTKSGVTVYVEGEKSSFVKSPAVGWALFDLYLGTATKTPQMKQEILASFTEWINR